MNKEKKNLAESVLHRLKNQAKSTHRRTDELFEILGNRTLFISLKPLPACA